MPRKLKPGDFVRIIKNVFDDKTTWGDDKGFLGVVSEADANRVLVVWVGIEGERNFQWTYFPNEVEYVALEDLTGEECALLMKRALTCDGS